ncbi:MAG: hypothetical protein OJF50_004545 [Nitrospira sp.]|nr:hypothetical protein [Nitrospira sp.]
MTRICRFIVPYTSGLRRNMIGRILPDYLAPATSLNGRM